MGGDGVGMGGVGVGMGGVGGGIKIIDFCLFFTRFNVMFSA